MRIGSLFSGVGGLELGLEWSGLGHTVWQVESDEWCRRQLSRHWPNAVRFDDVCTFGAGSNAPAIDLLCGGFPCTDVSSAGLGKGLEGERSGLWYQFARIARELAPEWCVVENVASGANRWVDAVVSGLEQLGYGAFPVPLSAEDVGAPHRRARVFVVARRVPNPNSEPLWNVEQRVPGGRPGRVCDEGARKPGDVGEALVDTGCERRNPREGSAWERRTGRAESWRTGDEVANGNGNRREALRLRGVDPPEQSGDLPPYGYDAHGRSGAWPWPPGPGDSESWAAYADLGGPEPAIRRGLDGLPCGMARYDWTRMLTALGNAVSPEQARHIGWLIRDLRD